MEYEYNFLPLYKQNEQMNQEPSITEQKLTEAAQKAGMTVRELKELVFQYQRQENKELKDVNDQLQELLRSQQFQITQKEIRNREIQLELEYHNDLVPEHKILMERLKSEKQAKDSPEPEKKKKLFSI